jgi:hypothetical protein
MTCLGREAPRSKVLPISCFFFQSDVFFLVPLHV